MASRYRSTTLRLARNHCARAVDYFERGDPYDRRVFAPGIACHAILQAIGEAVRSGRDWDCYEEVADAVCLRLATTVRLFDGTPESPMTMDDALAGRELAMNWLTYDPPTSDPHAHYELGIAVDRNWQIVPYGSPEHWYGQILDVVRVAHEELEEGSALVLRVLDYKTDWRSDASTLATIQLRGAGVLAALACEAGLIHPQIRSWGVLRRQVANVRLGRIYTDDIDASEDLRLMRWRREVELQIEALEHRDDDGQRPAAPGGGCVDCPYTLGCAPSQAYLYASGTPATAEDRATTYAIAVGTIAALKPLIQADSAEEPVSLRDGWVVGHIAEEHQEPLPDAHQAAWQAWESARGEALGLLKAVGLTAQNLRNLAKVRWPGKDGLQAREKFLSRVLAAVNVRKFGLHKLETGEVE